MFKAIVMDVDGTLTNSEKEISNKTKEVLMKTQENGIRLILASGRPVSGLMSLAKELDMDKYRGFLICYNGSRVVDCETNEVLFNQSISVDEAKEVVKHMKNFDVKVMVDKEDYMYVNDVYDCMINFKGPFNVIEYESRGGNFKLCEVDDFVNFIDFEPNKILTAGDPDYLNEHYVEMMKPFCDKLNCMFTGPFYFEFTACGIDKAKALSCICEKTGIKQEDMIAFGDGENDISMLEFCGMGIVMGNAIDEVKKVGDEVTLSNDEDGIAYSLIRHISVLS